MMRGGSCGRTASVQADNVYAPRLTRACDVTSASGHLHPGNACRCASCLAPGLNSFTLRWSGRAGQRFIRAVTAHWFVQNICTDKRLAAVELATRCAGSVPSLPFYHRMQSNLCLAGVLHGRPATCSPALALREVRRAVV
jgi:hypothetical protein